MKRISTGKRSLLRSLLRGREPSAHGPLARVDAGTAREAHKSNPFAVWAARARTANDANPDLACHRIWRAHPELMIRPKFRISAANPVFAAGSCFAREVEDALASLGFDVTTRCDELFDEFPLLHDGSLQAGVRPRAYLNRYNTMSMLDEFRHLLGMDSKLESGLLTYELGMGGAADLHYSQSLRQVDKATTLERRRRVREHLGPLLRRCKVLVLTLGMAECWFDEAAGRYLNNTPGPRVLAGFGDRLAVHLTRFKDHLKALASLHRLLLQVHGENFRIIITVSPVPLERSFLDQDVVLTNTYSKSMLRAVAQEFASAHDNVDYFPSFELVNFADPANAWAWDYRHVKPDLIEHIMTLFRRNYVEEQNA